MNKPAHKSRTDATASGRVPMDSTVIDDALSPLSENILALMYRILPDRLYLTSLDGRIKDFRRSDSGEVAEIAASPIGDQIETALPPDAVLAYRNAVKESLATGQASSFRYSLPVGDRDRTFYCRAVVSEKDDTVLLIVRDISEFVDAKQALEKSEVRYQTLLDNAPYPIIITDEATGKFLYYNARTLYEFGRSGGALIGKNSSVFYVDPQDRDLFRSIIREEGEATDFELQLYDYDHKPYWALMSGVRIDFQGKPAIMIAINNITERKIAELNLLREHEILTQKIAAQTLLPAEIFAFDDREESIDVIIQKALNSAALRFSGKDPFTVTAEYDGSSITSSYPGETGVFETKKPRELTINGLTTFGKTISLRFTFYRHTAKEMSKPSLEQEKHLAGSLLMRLTDIINQRNAAELLTEQDDFLRMMLSQTTFGISLVDPESLLFVHCNETAYHSLGFTHDEFMKLSICDIQKTCTPEQVREIFSRVSSGEMVQHEGIHLDKNGGEHAVLTHLYPLKLKGKAYTCLYWRDISDEKRREQEQKERTDRILLFARLIRKISTLRSGTDGEVALYIREVTEILGRETGLSGVSIWIQDNGGDSLTCLCSYDNATGKLDHGKQISKNIFTEDATYLQTERYFESADTAGDPRLNLSTRKYLNETGITAFISTNIFFKGHFQGILVFSYTNGPHPWDASEISLCCEVADQIGMAYLNHERIEVTRALQHSEYFLKRAQAVSKTGHWFYDIAGDFLSCSEETCRIFGISQGKSRTLSSFLKRSHPDDLLMVRDAFRAAKSGTPFHLTQRILVSGEIRWIEMRAEIEFDADNQPITFLGTVQDISEKIEAANELDRYRKHLEEMVRIRTSELEEATEAAKSANRAKSSFLSNMSHEIRTPINAIVGFAYLIRRDPLTPRQLDELNKLSAASEHLLQIINDILDLSKIEAGKIALETIDFEPVRVIDKILNIVEEDAVRKSIPISLAFDSVPPVVRGDGNRVAQILLNLMTNAVKFTEKGGITLSVKRVSENRSTITLEFRVQDTGIGITGEHMARLFDEFEQATDATTRKYGGTGLGLPITKRLTELMGGTIHVESAAGKGTTFCVVIPFAKSRQPAMRPAELSRLEGMRALIIDDSGDECEILASLLSEIGIRSDFDRSGATGLGRLLAADAEGDPYRLLFVDYRMPQTDGIEVLQRVSHSNLRHKPLLIMVTAHIFALKDDDRRNDLPFTLLTKPVTPSRLKDALNAALLNQLSARRGEEMENIRRELPTFTAAKILLVEDNAINREVAEGLLASVGLRADTAQNGRVAVERAHEKHYDLILMDLQMPEMDGYEATKEIRLLPGYDKTPIIAMTAVAFEEDRERCFEAGMSDHLPKPVDPDNLFSTLVKWLPPTLKKNGSADPAKEPDKTVMATSLSSADGGSTQAASERGRGAKISKSGDIQEPGKKSKNTLSLPTDTEDILTSLRTIDGLDPDFGLKNLQGNLMWYVKLIDQFINRHRADALDMADCLDQHDLLSVSKIAHGLKGTAATLGFQSIQEQSKALEIAAREERSEAELKPMIKLLGATLSTTADEIRRIIFSIRTFSPDIETGSADPVKVREIVKRILPLIESYDMEANTLFEENRDLLSRAFGYRVTALEQHLQLFDYKDAFKLLGEMLDRWEENLPK